MPVEIGSVYAKIFDSMYEGTLYGHWEAIVTLQQMLCHSRLFAGLPLRC